MKRRCLFILLMLLVVIGALSINAAAAENADWKIFNGRTGSGLSGHCVRGYVGSDTEVTIPRTHEGWTVLFVAQNAFSDADGVKKVTVGDNIKEIEYGGFAGATGLETVVLPESIRIGPAAFSGCTSLKNINFPYKQDVIDNNTFKDTALTSFTVMPAVYKIGYRAFAGCTQLTDIWMMDQVSYIESDAFEGVTATVHYSASRWDPARLQNYGGNLTWVAEEEYSFIDNTQTPIEYWIGGGRDLVLTVNAPAAKIHYVTGPNVNPFEISSVPELSKEQCTVVPVSQTQTQVVIKTSYLDALQDSDISISVYFTDGYHIYTKISRTSLPAGIEPESQPTKPKEHNYVTTVTPPMCTFQGYTTYTCTECGHSYQTDWVEALGHDNSEWRPDADNPGQERRECARCGQIESRAIGSTDATQPTDPSTQATDPSSQPTDPSIQATDPSVQVTDPSNQATDPSVQQTEPSATETIPAELKTDEGSDGLPVLLGVLGVLVAGASAAGVVLLKKRRK